jgi:uncharacterized protein YxjI
MRDRHGDDAKSLLDGCVHSTKTDRPRKKESSMSSLRWILALVVMAAASVPSASRAQEWTSTPATSAPQAATASAELDTEPRDGGQRYQMRQKLASFGDDFWIENDRGARVFKVNGKMMRVRGTLDFEDTGGTVKAQIQERMLRVKDSMAIEDGHGHKAAEVKRALITPIRERWVVKFADGPDLEVQGDLLAHEYRIGDGKQKVAKVSKKWFRIRDSYGVQIEPGQNDAVILAVTVAIDAMVHSGK